MTSKYNLALLSAVVAATADPGYGMFNRDADLEALVTDGLVAVNEAMTTEDGSQIAAMATDAGKKAHADAANGNAPTEAPKEKPTFTVTTMKKPEPVRRTRESGESKYPFDDLAAPDANGNVSSFFVPATADMPDPAKSLASAVSQANRRYGSVVGKNARGHDKYQYTRVFRITASDDPKGAYVWRDEDARPNEPSDGDENADQGDGNQG